MDALRRRMLGDMRIRNYAPASIQNYIYHVDQFYRHYLRCPSELGISEIIEYLTHRVESGRWSYSWHSQAVSALRFLYGVTLGREWVPPQIPYPRATYSLPTVLSQEEVQQLIQGTRRARHRLMLMTMYSAGLRLSEALHLTRSDIDPARMIIHVRHGKGRKDRLVPLSVTLLDTLREDWRRHGERWWLFPGPHPSHPITGRAVQHIIPKCGSEAGLIKRVTSRTLRHSFATHLLEAGVDILSIQAVLGHARLTTTMKYLHLNHRRIAAIPSPLDRLTLRIAPFQLELPVT